MKEGMGEGGGEGVMFSFDAGLCGVVVRSTRVVETSVVSMGWGACHAAVGGVV